MERIFHAYKMRYHLLNHELTPLRASTKIKTVNIYINLDNFFHCMHSSTTNEEFQLYGEYSGRQLVANIINLIGHYKHWAIKEHLIPKIFTYYTSSNTFKNSLIIGGYRNNALVENSLTNTKYFYINRTIKDAIPIIPVITKYLPNIYSIDSGYIEPSIIPYYLSNKYKADLHLLVSRDDYDLQYSYMTNWVLLRPNGDNSKIITKGTLWKYIQNKEKISYSFYFNPGSYLWAKAVLGDKYRCIPKLTRISWKTLLQYLKKYDTNTSEIFEVQQNYFVNFINDKKIEDTEFNNNLYCSSVKMQVEALLTADQIIIDQQLEDLIDLPGLYTVCNNIFKETPINMQFILTETPSENDTPHDKYFWERRN